MGVVYKLKPKIIEFIVQQKKENPSLGCRALSSIVQERFDQKVSKSSINNVLKEANLSSSVGRRSGTTSPKRKKAKTFQLSEERRKGLFADVSQQCILADMSQDSAAKDVIDGVGSIFFKAAEWELARTPILEGFLKDSSEKEGRSGRIRDVASIMSFLKVFHIESLEQLSHYSGRGLWELNNIDSPVSENDILDVLGNIRDKQEVLLKFSLKAPQIFTKAAGFRFILKDGSNFFLDGQTASCWKNIQRHFLVSLSKATDLLAKILNNVQTAIFCSISPKETGKIQETRHIFDVIHAFENVQSKKIQKIELLGEDGQILGNFDNVPQIKRTFIAGIWPWEGIFQQFLDIKKPKREGKIDREVIGRDLNFKEAVFNYGSRKKRLTLRAIALLEPFIAIPFVVLLSNVDDKGLPAESIVRQYCQRWPNMEKGGSFSVISDLGKWGGDSSTEEDSFWDVFLGNIPYGRDPVWLVAEQLTVLLNRFAKRQFFAGHYQDIDFYAMQNRFYSMPGRIFKTGTILEAELHIPDKDPYFEDLSFAAQRVNESGVKDFEDRQVQVRCI